MKNKLTLLLLLVASGVALAATFTYKCPTCGLIQQYSWVGIYKCPNDGTIMQRR